MTHAHGAATIAASCLSLILAGSALATPLPGSATTGTEIVTASLGGSQSPLMESILLLSAVAEASTRSQIALDEVRSPDAATAQMIRDWVEYRGFRGFEVPLQSVPEPATALMLATGLAGIAAVGGRSRRRG